MIRIEPLRLSDGHLAIRIAVGPHSGIGALDFDLWAWPVGEAVAMLDEFIERKMELLCGLARMQAARKAGWN